MSECVGYYESLWWKKDVHKWKKFKDWPKSKNIATNMIPYLHKKHGKVGYH